MALKAASPPLLGSPEPRIGAGLERAEIENVRQHARKLGLELMPSQEFVISVAEARGPNGKYRYRDVVDVEARRNGKSAKLKALIRSRIEAGRKVVHTAQNRSVPRAVFLDIAGSYSKHEARVRLANGQEEVALRETGGSYTIVAPERGVRGLDGDDLILDEVREFKTFEFINAFRPINAASPDGQNIWLSNAGDAESLVLNDLKLRAESLGYMEWSASPELDPADLEGWAQANPALGRTIDLEYLRGEFAFYRDSGNLAGWETEHLCRWVLTMAPRLIDPNHWLAARAGLSKPVRPSMGISVHPSGSRASAALSWPQGDGTLGLMVLADVTGNPIDLDRFGKDLLARANAAGIVGVGYDPLTDAHLARWFSGAQGISGQAFANASERFVRNVENRRLHWEWADQLTEDLPQVSRKPLGRAAFMAEPVDPRRPVTAALAAIRGHWLAAEPNVGAPSVY